MRTIVEHDRVSQIIDAEQVVYPRLEQAFDAVKWWLSRKPDTGKPLDDVYWVYKQRGDKHLNIPSLVALYTFDMDTVELVAVLVRIPTL